MPPNIGSSGNKTEQCRRKRAPSAADVPNQTPAKSRIEHGAVSVQCLQRESRKLLSQSWDQISRCPMSFVVLLRRCCSEASPVPCCWLLLSIRKLERDSESMRHWTLWINRISIEFKLQRGLHLFGGDILSSRLAPTDVLRCMPFGLDVCWRRGSSDCAHPAERYNVL